MGRYRGYGTDKFVEGRLNQSLEDRISALEVARSASTSIQVTLHEPHEPFTVAYRPNKGDVTAVLPIDLPSSTQFLEIVCIGTNDRDTDAHFENRRIHSIRYLVDDDQRTQVYGEFPFPGNKGGVEYNKQYDLLR